MKNNQKEIDKELRHQAAILFIKDGIPIRLVAEKLNVPVSKLTVWSNEDKWMDLRREPLKVANSKMREAAILYIKQGLTETAISEKINISMQSLTKWKKAEKWDELRPDFELLHQYKAAGMFIDKGMTENEISQHLGISEITIKYWIDLYGWEAARLIHRAQDITTDVLERFCQYFKTSFPDDRAKIEVMQKQYLKSIAPLI